MAKYELKTKATAVSVDEFINAVADERQREEAKQITAMMERLSGHPPKIWGPSIIGFAAIIINMKAVAKGTCAASVSAHAREIRCCISLMDMTNTLIFWRSLASIRLANHASTSSV